MNTSLAVIADDREKKQIEALRAQCEKALQRYEDLVIKDQKTYDLAVSDRVSLTQQVDFITAVFEPMRTRTYAAYQSVLDTKRALLDPVKERLASRNRSLGEWDDEQERVRKAAEQKLLEKNTKQAAKQREKDIAKAKAKGNTELVEVLAEAPLDIKSSEVEDTYEKSDSISMREKYEAEVVDFMALVKFVAKNKHMQYLLKPNQSAINTLARAQKELFSVPGLKLKRTKKPATNSSARRRN